MEFFFVLILECLWCGCWAIKKMLWCPVSYNTINSKALDTTTLEAIMAKYFRRLIKRIIKKIIKINKKQLHMFRQQQFIRSLMPQPKS